MDLIAGMVPWLMRAGAGGEGGANLVLMGRGDEALEASLRLLQETYPASVCACIGYDRALEHRLIAAADMLLMPSRYEPCGLPQMYALRYGTVPVVHATGGLKDSVMHLDERQLAFGTGFLFHGVDSSAALQVRV